MNHIELVFLSKCDIWIRNVGCFYLFTSKLTDEVSRYVHHIETLKKVEITPSVLELFSSYVLHLLHIGKYFILFFLHNLLTVAYSLSSLCSMFHLVFVYEKLCMFLRFY